jgi:hypothetical protein
MFEAKLDDVSLLRESIATISELIDETEFRIKKDGIELVASDRESADTAVRETVRRPTLPS